MKPLLITILLVFYVIAPSSTVRAEDERIITADEAAAKRLRALELRAGARELRRNAESLYKKDSADCRKVVLVNNCLNAARDRRLEKIEQARAVELDIGALERDIRRFELAERRAERAKKLEERQLPTTVSVDGAKTATLSPGAPPATPTPAPEATPAR